MIGSVRATLACNIIAYEMTDARDTTGIGVSWNEPSLAKYLD